MTKAIDLTEGSITRTMLAFAVPMIIGNLLQQLYNVADTLIVGQFLGANALAAVGSAYTLMIFLTSVLLGLCMGSGAVFSHRYGAKQTEVLKKSVYVSFVWISVTTLLLNVAVFVFIHPIISILQVPAELYSLMYDYLRVIFWGIGFTFLYNFYASLLRAIGNSMVPLWFLAVAVLLNIILDFLFILFFNWGVEGAGWATVISQAVSAIGLCFYTFLKFPELRIGRKDMRMEWKTVREIASYSALTCAQQSVMNFGILMVQGLINSFGTTVMAAFAAAVKIALDTVRVNSYVPRKLAEEYGEAVQKAGSPENLSDEDKAKFRPIENLPKIKKRTWIISALATFAVALAFLIASISLFAVFNSRFGDFETVSAVVDASDAQARTTTVHYEVSGKTYIKTLDYYDADLGVSTPEQLVRLRIYYNAENPADVILNKPSEPRAIAF